MTVSSEEITILSLKKEKGKYKVTTSEGLFFFNEDVIIKHLILKDKVFSKDDFEKILNEEKDHQLFNKTLKFLSFQSRSTEEINEYLKDKQASEEEINKIVLKLKELGYINDDSFASEMLDYVIRSHKGPKVLEEKLKQKGLSEELISDTLTKYDYYTEKEIASDLATKLVSKFKANPVKHQKMTLYQKLLRDGFNNEIITEVIDRVNFIDESDDKLEKEIKKLILKYSKFSGYDLRNKIISNLMSKGYEYSQINEKLNKGE